MSFWTKIRDTATAPVRATGDLIGDLAGGRNVFDSARDFAARQLSSSLSIQAATFDTKPFQLAAEKISPITLGVTGDFSQNMQLASRINQGGEFTKSELWTATKTTVKGGALVAAGVATGGAVAGAGAGTVTAAAAGYGVARSANSFLETGKPETLLQAVPGASTYFGAPPEYADAFNQLKDYFSNQPQQTSAPAKSAPPAYLGPYDPTEASTQSGYENYGKPKDSSIATGLVMAGVAIALLRLRKKRR